MNPRTKTGVTLLICTLLASLAAFSRVRAEQIPAPEYETGVSPVDTILRLRTATRSWWGRIEDQQRRRIERSSWEAPGRTYMQRIAEDFPTFHRSLSLDLEKRTFRVDGALWFHRENTVAFEKQMLGGIARRLRENLDGDHSAVKDFERHLASTSQGTNEDSVHRRWRLYAHAVNYLDSLELNEAVEYLARCAAHVRECRDTELIQRLQRGRVESRIQDITRRATDWSRGSLERLSHGDGPPAMPPRDLRTEVASVESLVGPLYLCSLGAERIVFVTRDEVRGYYHWYESFGYQCDNPDRWNIQNNGRLVVRNLRIGQETDLINDPEGAVRDPQVHYNGQRIIFSYRPGGTKHFHLYEIHVDGSGLRQLTFGDDDDDIEPCYLPNGDIVFCSSRCRRWVPCLNAPVATLYKCDADGSNIRPLTANVETENTPWVLPDGRVLFMRWEYVERDRGFPHNLWTINPDGTGIMTFWGNMNEGDVFIDAKSIPDTNEVVFIAHPHGSGDHVGTIGILHPDDGPDEHKSIHWVTPYSGLKRTIGWRDPFPVGADCLLACQQDRLYVMDRDGNRALLQQVPKGWIHEPCVIRTRQRPPIIPSRIELARATGEMILSDVTHGRNMEGVQEGEVDRLLVLEVLPKPVHHDGHTETISWNGNFFIERVLGTVPVEPDGSAYFEVPAQRCLFFVAVDKQGAEIKRMQSFVTVQPGERTSCVGCHENRTDVAKRSTELVALGKPPAKIASPGDHVPSIFHFPRDIQPILNRHCVECHDNDTREGDVVLNDDLDPWFNQAYVTLKTRRLFASGFGGVGGQGNLPPRSVGAAASPLWQLIEKGHYDVQLSQREKDMIYWWIESWCTYSGTFASLNKDPNRRIMVEQTILERRCSKCHNDTFRYGRHHSPSAADMRESFGLRVNYTHPEASLLLRAPLAKEAGGLEICRNRKAVTYEETRTKNNTQLGNDPTKATFTSTNDPDYQKMLGQIREAAAKYTSGRLELPGFTPHHDWVREMKRNGCLPDSFAPDGSRDLEFYFDIDEKYYQRFWPKRSTLPNP